MTGIVVTGASSGIGRAIAVRLARHHGRFHDSRISGNGSAPQLLLHYCRNQTGAQETADLVRAEGVQCEIVAADLAEPRDVARLADAAFDQLEQVDVWVNNAGVDVLTGETAQLSFDEKLERLLDVDVRGTIALSRLVAPRLVEQIQAIHAAASRQVTDESVATQRSPIPPSASMVFIGWDQSSEGMEGDAGMMFAPVKAAVTAFATSLAQTLAPYVRVNTVAPGWIQTSWGESTSDYWDSRAKQQSLMERWGRPEDVAEAVAFLASPEAVFITGQTLPINGGWNRRFNPTDASSSGKTLSQQDLTIPT